MPALHSRPDVNTRMFLFCSTLLYIYKALRISCLSSRFRISLPSVLQFKTKPLEVSGIVR